MLHFFQAFGSVMTVHSVSNGYNFLQGTQEVTEFQALVVWTYIYIHKTIVFSTVLVISHVYQPTTT